jgi:hypothetical protein
MASSTQRLPFLARVAEKESRHLAATTKRLFAQPFTPARAAQLEDDPELGERVDAFVARFGRLQDTLGDKLLPALLTALGERVGAVIDNLDRAERLGFIPSADEWMTMRKLRNQMIREYIENPLILADALEAGHRYVPVLVDVTARLGAELEHRGWVS